uniref:Uncharacterized protein n=1 Tax=Bionectria ochroleuca TaxID=29856 RepID=A0A0B7KR76_BIOOC
MIQTEDKSESCLLPLRKEEKIAHTTTMSFLEMEQYGPFPVDSYIQMFYLSRIMLAYSMNGGIQ